MHPLLGRQLKRLGLSLESPPDPAAWAAFLDKVEQSYAQADQDRYTLERSFQVSSDEMGALYAQLRTSEVNFRLLADHLPDAIFVREGSQVVYANRATAELLDLSDPEELLGRDPITFVHPDDAEAVLAYRASADGDDVAPIRVRWRGRDGRVTVLHGRNKTIEFNGRPACLTVTRDITEELARVREREEAEQALRASDRRHRVLFDASPLAKLIFLPESLRILGANDAATELLGYSKDELVSMTMADLKVPDEVAEMVRFMENERAQHSTNRAQFRGTKRYRTKDGRMLDVEICSHGVELDGRTVRLSALTDVTERLRLEDQLRQSQKMEAIGQLAGGIAHDFNNILAIVMSDAAYLKEELPPGHPLQDDAGRILLSARKAAGLTRQLLAFSRKQVLMPRVIGLSGVVNQMYEMLVRLLPPNIELDVSEDPALGATLADPVQIEQVILNLVVNARDAMPGGGGLHIRTRNAYVKGPDAAAHEAAEGAYVVMEIEDTGVGIDPSLVGRIFEPFFTTKEVGKGTGLGLATVLGIVKQSGGFVDVRSQPGEGSTFSIYLPRVASESARVVARPGVSAPPPA